MTYFARRHVPDAPTTPTRALDATFTPSTTKWTMVMYTINLACNAGQTSTVELRSDNAATPTTARCSATLAPVGGTSVAVRQELVYLVPPGDTVKLVSAGTGTPTIAHQTECAIA